MLFIHVEPIFFGSLILLSTTICALKANQTAIFQLQNLVCYSPFFDFVVWNEWHVDLAGGCETVVEIFWLDDITTGRKIKRTDPSACCSVSNFNSRRANRRFWTFNWTKSRQMCADIRSCITFSTSVSCNKPIFLLLAL